MALTVSFDCELSRRLILNVNSFTQSDISNLFLPDHSLLNELRSQEDQPSPTTLQQSPGSQTQTPSNVQSADTPISAVQPPPVPSLPRHSSESAGSHHSFEAPLNHSSVEINRVSASPAVAAERYPVSQPASLATQAAPQPTKAKAAGGRAKRQRPPAVVSAALTKLVIRTVACFQPCSPQQRHVVGCGDICGWQYCARPVFACTHSECSTILQQATLTSMHTTNSLLNAEQAA